jgi:hypothetical protein
MKLRLKGLTDRVTAADTLLFIILIVISVTGLVFIKEVLPKGTDAIIEVDGKAEYSVPLYEEKVIEVEGVKGVTVVELKDGKVRITDSPCPDKLCVKQGWIDRGAIVCLPNRVIVRTDNNAGQGQQLDAVTR